VIVTIKNIITSICVRDTVMCCVQIEREGLFDLTVLEGFTCICSQQPVTLHCSQWIDDDDDDADDD